jgi:hypothetical protein
MDGFMRKQTLIVLALALLLPEVSFAAALLTARDTIAGIGTTVEMRSLTPHVEATVAVEPPYGPLITERATASAEGTLAVRIPGTALSMAGTYRVSAEQAKVSIGTTTFAVEPDTMESANSTLEAESRVLAADGTDALTVRAVLRDRYGNPLPGRRVELISSRTVDTVTALGRETDADGVQLFSITTTQPGAVDLRAMDLLGGKLLGSSLQLVAESPLGIGGYAYAGGGRALYGGGAPAMPPYSPYGTYPADLSGRRFYGQIGTIFDIVHHFEITIERGLRQVNVYDPLSVEIRAMDRNNRVVEDYVGAVKIYTTDPDALMPGEVRFTPSDFGMKRLSLSLRFNTEGEPNSIGEPTHVIRIEESASCDTPVATGCVFGELELIVRGAGSGDGGQKLITVKSPVSGSTVSTPEIMLEGIGPPFINVRIAGGMEPVAGDTDRDGKFSVPIRLDSQQIDHTLRVRDPSGRYDSGDILIRLDTTPPEIGPITFDPQSPEQETTFMVKVNAEPGLPIVILTLNGVETKLKAASAESGTYSGTAVAPSNEGVTTATVRVEDSAGNISETRIQITIAPKALPVVTGLRALAKMEQVELTWNPITDTTVDGYRIYVGTSPGDFSSFLDSLDQRGGATIGGLKAGTTYSFAVTAIQGNRESGTKSAEVSSTVLGLTLDVTPQDGGLLLEWSSLEEDLPLSSFILEYGVEPNKFTEKRTVNGDLRVYALRDLLNDVTYFARLTPVTTTAEILEGLAAEGQGTPASTGRGFKSSPVDPVPFPTNIAGGTSAIGSTPAGILHSGAPSTPRVGIPPLAWWVAGLLTLVIGYVHWQRRKTVRMTFEFLQGMEQRYHHG